jgi:hypothetical protein
MKKLLTILLVILTLTACKSQPQPFVKIKSAKTDRVQIESAYFTAPSYIIIREAGSGDVPGPIIGQSILYPVGPVTGGVIATASLRSGQKYLAEIRVENGDYKFTESLDQLAKTTKGQAVNQTFTTN